MIDYPQCIDLLVWLYRSASQAWTLSTRFGICISYIFYFIPCILIFLIISTEPLSLWDSFCIVMCIDLLERLCLSSSHMWSTHFGICMSYIFYFIPHILIPFGYCQLSLLSFISLNIFLHMQFPLFEMTNFNLKSVRLLGWGVILSVESVYLIFQASDSVLEGSGHCLELIILVASGIGSRNMDLLGECVKNGDIFLGYQPPL